MFLQKLNIVREAGTEEEINRLKADGFRPISSTEEPVKEVKPEPLETLTVAQLKKLAIEKGIKGANSLTKKDLLEVLEDDSFNGESEGTDLSES